MKYFNPSYWFKLWVLSAPLFNDKTQGINAKSIDNKKIKDWVSNNTSLESIENQELNLSNNQTIQLQNDENIKSIKNLETDHFYENFLKTQGWSRDPQITQHQVQEIQEEHHQFLKKQHQKNRNKRHFLGIGNWIENILYSKPLKNTGNKVESHFSINPFSREDFVIKFIPEFWEEVIYLKSTNLEFDFIHELRWKIYEKVDFERTLAGYAVDLDGTFNGLGKYIYNNWYIINYIKSSNSNDNENKRIKFYFTPGIFIQTHIERRGMWMNQ